MNKTMNVTWWPVSELTAEEKSEWRGDTLYWVTVPMFLLGKYDHSYAELAYYDEQEGKFSCESFSEPLGWDEIDAIALADIPEPYVAGRVRGE